MVIRTSNIRATPIWKQEQSQWRRLKLVHIEKSSDRKAQMLALGQLGPMKVLK